MSLHLSCHVLHTIAFNYCCSEERKEEAKGKRLSTETEERMIFHVTLIESEDSSLLTIALFVDIYFYYVPHQEIIVTANGWWFYLY